MTPKKSSSKQRPELTTGKNCLKKEVETAMEKYFRDLDGHEANNLYDLFLEQVEKPLLEVVIRNTDRNLSRASKILGMNRATLRNRLKKYGLD